MFMQEQKSRRQLRRMVSGFLAVALVVSAVPGQVTVGAKTKGKTAKQICLSSPVSAKGQKVKTSLYLKEGSRFQIKSKVSPASAGKKMVYKSSKKKIAAVSRKGQIVAKKCGKTRITIRPDKNSKVSATIAVTVVKKLKKVKKIKINAAKLSITAGSKKKLTAKVVSPKKPTTKKFNWFSSNKKVASVSQKGVVTAKKAGTAKITVTSADGRGAKAVCSVTVTEAKENSTPTVSQTPAPTPNITGSPTPTATATPAPGEDITLAVVVPGERTGIKQGEELQLAAKDSKTDTALTSGITWAVNELTGVHISDDGLLTVAKDALAGAEITVTATADSAKKPSASATLTIIENQTAELSEKMMQLNQDAEDQPLGLTYRSTAAYSTVSDPERGDVIRFDASKGYTSNSYDVLAWLTVDPMYAGKTVTISAYLKYDEVPDVNVMNLVINERWGYSNPACQYNALPGNWYYITGTYTLPEYKASRYNGDTNKIYICRDGDHLADDVNAVYYIDDLMITAEKGDIESVSLSAAEDATEIYQNHTLQFSAEVTGTNVPMQKVNYSIEPAVEGASVSEDGLLTVGNVAAGTEIHVKASSYEDPTKSDTKTVKVLAQSIDSISISAAGGNPEVIYQNNTLQFSAAVTSSGGPDESIEWSIDPTVEGASISEDGLLTVGNVADGTMICVKATSVFDKEQSVPYVLTVRENKVNQVTVSTAGGKTTISSDLPLNLSANVDVTGTPSTQVTWSISPEVSGASLQANGNNATLSVDSTVADETEITVKAVSQFDTSKYGEVTITVSNASSAEFDLNKLSVSYYEDFETTTTLEALEEAGIFSYQCSNPYSSDSNMTNSNLSTAIKKMQGLRKEAANIILQRSSAFNGFFGDPEKDYIQFALKNDSGTEKTYTLSFFFLFGGSPIDKGYKYDDYAEINYQLPIKLVSSNEEGSSSV